MHELSIAQSIMEIVLKEADRQSAPARVTVIGLKIGALSGILPDALAFGFDAIKKGTPLAGCRLAIEEVPVRGHCRHCDRDFEVRELMFACPHCSSSSIDVVQGQELDIAYIEVDDETEELHVK